MSIYGPDYDYFHEPTEFEQEVDGFKEALRKAVKQEVTDEIKRLQAENREQAEKLTNLNTLEAEAKRKGQEYEYKLARANMEARREIEKEGIRKLLDVLAEPRYRVEVAWHQGPKCECCNENRDLEYTTPRGKPATERCECSVATGVYEVREQLVHEISKRNRELVVWYSNTKKFFTSSDDTIGSGVVLKSPAGVSDEELMGSPREYGFASKEDAQRIADALNNTEDEVQKGTTEAWV